MSRIEKLTETRNKAADSLKAVLDKADKVLEERALTEDEQAEIRSAEKQLEQLDKELRKETKRAAKANDDLEQRDNKVGGGVGGAHVGADHTRVYGPENPQNSYYQDLLDANFPASPAFDSARSRLQENHRQITRIVREQPASEEGKAVRTFMREVERRRIDPRFSAEYRATDLEAGAMGGFAPPLYFLTNYAPYRTYGRTLISQLRNWPMPDTGMVINVPKIGQPTQANDQGAIGQANVENTTVTTRDMTSTYESGTLHTVIDNLMVSQQYLDRLGPGIGGDKIVRDDQNRQMNRQLNIYAWTQLLNAVGAANTITWSPTTPGPLAENANLYKVQVHAAKAAIRATDGTVAYPTHIFHDAETWETIEGSFDKNGRPFVVPSGVAFNPLVSAGDEPAAVPEGYSGFRFAGLPAFVDESLWIAAQSLTVPFTNRVVVTGAFDIAVFWLEGAPVVRVLPQPFAESLTVLLQQYVYCAFVPVYPSAIKLITGTGLGSAELLVP